MESRERVRMIVQGRVQGVFFRDSTRRKALELGLAGYVRNISDGSVEIVAEGPAAALKQLVQWARKGPPASVVKGVDIEYGEAADKFSSFNIHNV